MNWSFLIAFGIGIACYFVALGIFVLIKYLRNKKNLKKQEEEHKDELNG